MKKLFLKITLCIFITSINLLIELYPTGKIYLFLMKLKKKI